MREERASSRSGVLKPEQIRQVQELVTRIRMENPQALLQFGASVQGQLARLADQMLGYVRERNTPEQISVLLYDLVSRLEEANPDALLNGARGFWSRLFRTSPRKVLEKKLAHYQCIGSEVEQLADILERLRHQMLRDLTMLDMMYQKYEVQYSEMDVYIAAVRQKRIEVDEQLLPMLEQRLASSGDVMDAQAVTDARSFSDRLAARENDLLVSQTIALQALPQIRLIQENHRILIDKIQSSILLTIPLWKNQMMALLTLCRQQTTQEAAGEALQRAANACKQTSVGLTSIVEEALMLEKDGREARIRAEKKLAAGELHSS